MHSISWDDMRYLLAVARSGSMSGASRSLDVNHTTVIRRIRSLEQSLGTAMFDRVGHAYHITPAGQEAYEAAVAMESTLASLERAVVGQVTELSGLIRVTAPEGMANLFLLPALYKFRQIYPDIVVDLQLSTRIYDLSLREADVAFRITQNPPPDVVGSQLATMATAVYRPRGSNLTLANIDKVIALSEVGDGLPEWARQYTPDASVSLYTDAHVTMAEAVKSGFGVASLVCAIADPEPELERVPDIPLSSAGEVWMLTHVDVRTNARIRVFRDFMRESIRDLIDLVEGRQPIL